MPREQIKYHNRTLIRWVSDDAPDPHSAGTTWRFDAKWGLQWMGEGLGEFRRGWTGNLGVWVSTPERIALWYRLMRQTQEEPT